MDKTQYIYVCVCTNVHTHYIFRLFWCCKVKLKLKRLLCLHMGFKQQLISFLVEHHSEVSSEQHERLHQVSTYLFVLESSVSTLILHHGHASPIFLTDNKMQMSLLP